jgi:hypothetical protein
MDHGWHNLLVDDAEAIQSVLDWGSLCATPPAFDLAIAELHLAGGWWLALPEVPDRRPLVRDAMLPAYRAERSLPPALDRQRRCYQLDVLQAWLRSLDDWNGVAARGIPDDKLDDAEDGFRELVDGLLPRSGQPASGQPEVVAAVHHRPVVRADVLAVALLEGRVAHRTAGPLGHGRASSGLADKASGRAIPRIRTQPS